MRDCFYVRACTCVRVCACALDDDDVGVGAEVVVGVVAGSGTAVVPYDGVEWWWWWHRQVI